MEKKKPLKRDKAIQPLSRDHHHNLLLCWKIKKGFSKGVEPKRMKKYTNWFFTTYVLPHFQIEEKYLFPVLGADHPLIQKALTEHRRLTNLFSEERNVEESLLLLQDELESHIRFEERVLFMEIQKKATREQLEIILEKHSDAKFKENNSDPFWL